MGNTTDKPQPNAMSLKGKNGAIIIYPVNKGIGIDIFNKKGRIERLDISREQWLEISTMVLSECFGAKVEPVAKAKTDA